jgi:uncharacterized surface protein with fasciclin (FAS1) repeats
MKKQRYILPVLILTVMISVLAIISCRDDIPDEIFFEEDELLISDYMEEHPDKYSTLIKVLEITDLKRTLNAYGHYTFFAPDNNAFSEFCSQAGKNSVEEFDTDYLVTLIRYHLIDVEIESSYFRDGVIPDTTYSGDYLVITYSEGGLETIHVNEAMITERDILVENGVIHTIDKVLAPKVGSIFSRIKESADYSIFGNALELAGLDDTLNFIRIDLNEDIFIRSRFTIFAEPDEVYNQAGIFTAENLVAHYSDTGDPADKDDGFYKYMAYHIVPGLYYLNNIDSFNYPTLLQNALVNAKLDDNIYLNWHLEDDNGQPVENFITIVEEGSNQQAKNGVFHRIDRIMEPWIPAPVYTVIDLTDYQGLNIGRIYTEKDLEYIRGISAENTGIYFRNSTLTDGLTNLQTTSTAIGWVVEFEIPPILRGQYDIWLHWASDHSNNDLVQVLWDGAPLGSPISLEHQKRWPDIDDWLRSYNTSEWLGRLLLTEVTSHKIKFIALEEGYGNFDYLVLRPATDKL